MNKEIKSPMAWIFIAITSTFFGFWIFLSGLALNSVNEQNTARAEVQTALNQFMDNPACALFKEITELREENTEVKYGLLLNTCVAYKKDQFPIANQTLDIINAFNKKMEARMGIKAKLVAINSSSIPTDGSAYFPIAIYADNNWKIYLNNIDAGSEQFNKFYALFNEDIKDTNKSLEYIDLRFGNRIFWK